MTPKLVQHPRYGNNVDWTKVYNGVFNPQNIATHNKRRWINYMSGNVGWLIGSVVPNKVR